jgi:hypothetical protein
MELGTQCDRCGQLWFPLDRGWLHMLDLSICGSCVTPLDERAVLLAVATATLQVMAMEGEGLDRELRGLSDRVGQEYVRQLDQNRELRFLWATVQGA